MTYQVLVDLGKLKRLYSGLGQYSLYFGKTLSRTYYEDLHWNFLTPSRFIKKFGNQWHYENLSFQRRYFPASCKPYHLWHAIHQDSAYFPGNIDIPYILTIHDLNFLKEKNSFIAGQRLRKLQEKVNRASIVTFISHYTASVAFKHLSLEKKNTRVIYNGVDIETGKKVKKPAFLPTGKFLFSIGMVLEKKNFHVLIDLMQYLPDYNLIIAGDKSDFYAHRIEREIRKRKLEKRILLPGIITHEEKIYLYKHCEAFVFPSKMEGFGLPVIEAMRFGKPVFTSNFSSLPEIGDQYAFYWDSFQPEAMHAVFSQKMSLFKKNRRELSENMIDYSRRFKWEESISRYTALYEQVIQEHYDNQFKLSPLPVTGKSQASLKKLRVLHLSSEASWRGGEQQIAYLIEELSGKTENFIACRKGSEFEKHCKQKKWEYHSLDFSSPIDLITAGQISELCRKYAIDILHLHTSVGHTLGVLSTWFGHQARLVLSRRVDVPIKKNAFSRWKYNHYRIERILTVSDAIRHILNETLVNQNVARTVHSGIDYRKFNLHKPKKILKDQYHLQENQLLVGNTSALADHKDYYTFIDTAAYVINKGKDVIFFIIGEGPERKNIERYIEQKNLTERVLLTGFISNIENVIPELDIFLMTSKTEGLGTSILDAFAAEVPVVATRAGGIPEMVKNEDTGLLANVKDFKSLGDNIIRLINDRKLRQHLTSRAKDFLIEEYTKEKTAERTFRTYQEIINI